MKKFGRKFKIKLQKIDPKTIDDQTLLLNLYITQAITLLLAVMIIWVQSNHSLGALLRFPSSLIPVLWGAGFAGIVLIVNYAAGRIVPEHLLDDGGLNEQIFRKRSVAHIFVICLVVAIAEELLFRGAIQHILGPYWTSILFAAIHFRYLRHWLMTGLVFGISYGLGWIYVQTGTLWTPIIAHFIIDFVLGCIIKFRRGKQESCNK